MREMRLVGPYRVPGFGYDCQVCEAEGRRAGEIGEFDHGFIVCPECGNKRCPKATYHEHTCSGSNALGQHGSVWGDFVLEEEE